MNTYTIEQLIKLWQQEKISSEQAIGQLLLHMQRLHDELEEVKHAKEILKQSLQQNQ